MQSRDLPVYRGAETLDPRLRSLLQLGPTALFQLHQSETQHFERAMVEFERTSERLSGANEIELPKLLAAAQQARLGLVPPRTFAIHYPSDDPDAGYVSALIWSDASAEDLTAAGIRVHSQAITVFSANIPLRLLWPFMTRSVAAIELAAAFKYVELARPWQFDLTVAVPVAGGAALHASGITGNGVVVGIIDSGIDIYHPHFIDAAGSSRIEYLWDQTLTRQGGEQNPPAGPKFSAGYGVEYTNAHINSDLPNSPPHQVVRSKDVEGHGTVVASCAASSGHVVGGVTSYVGAAPGARIIAVKLDGNRESRAFARSESVLDAIAYIYDRAASLGAAAPMPCVINLSMSDNMGAHDGTSLGERYIDEMLALAPGRAFVCSAGNQNIMGLHVSNVVPPVGNSSVDLKYKAAPASDPTLPDLEPKFDDDFQIWYDGHDRLSLTIDVPATATTDAVTVGPVAPLGIVTVNIPKTTIDIKVTSLLGDPLNGDNCIYVAIHNKNKEVIPLVTWTWRLTPAPGSTLISGEFHIWADKHPGSGLRSWVPATPNDQTIGIPSTSNAAITVGMHGPPAPSSPNDPGSVIPSSGWGPTRDGRIKPELCASGIVTAARSKDLTVSSGLLVQGSGTSCAAPLVAGSAALLFECRGGSLTSTDIKQLLLDVARPSAEKLNAVGFGTLDVSAGCLTVLKTADVWIRDSALDSGVEPYTGADPPFHSPDIVLLDAAGDPTANPQYHPTNLWNNRIDVTVRNRGTGDARNVDVYLYWTDPATYIPFPSAWYSSGIYTGAALKTESNRIVVNRIPAGGSATVQFAWAPPNPGSNITGDAHFCLLARVEHEDDASNLGAGGWGVIAGSNNIAMRNVDVLDVSAPPAPTSLRIVGTAEIDSVEFWADGFSGDCDIILPTSILPWRDLRTLAALPVEARGQVNVRELNRDLDRRAVARILGATGVSAAQIRGSLTQLRTEGESLRVNLPYLRLEENAVAPVRIVMNHVQLRDERGILNIAQRSGGKIVGGVQLEYRHRVPAQPRYIVTHSGDDVIIRRAEENERPNGDVVPRRIPPQWRHIRRRTTV